MSSALGSRLPADPARRRGGLSDGISPARQKASRAEETGATDPADFDAAVAVAREAGLGGTVEVTAPADAAGAWVMAQKDNVWPVHYDQVAVDAEKGEVTSHSRWADYPLLAKLSKLGVQGHMGVLFGIVNQIVPAVTALGLTAVTI